MDEYFVTDNFDNKVTIEGPFSCVGLAVEHALDVIYCNDYRILSMQDTGCGLYIIATKGKGKKTTYYCPTIGGADLHDALGTLVLYRR